MCEHEKLVFFVSYDSEEAQSIAKLVPDTKNINQIIKEQKFLFYVMFFYTNTY